MNQQLTFKEKPVTPNRFFSRTWDAMNGRKKHGTITERHTGENRFQVCIITSRTGGIGYERPTLETAKELLNRDLETRTQLIDQVTGRP